MSSDLERIDGIGPSTAQKLINHGFRTIESLASATVRELAVIDGITETLARKIIMEEQRAFTITPASRREFSFWTECLEAIRIIKKRVPMLPTKEKQAIPGSCERPMRIAIMAPTADPPEIPSM